MKIKRVVDAFMVVLFLLLMAKQLTGSGVHEYLGVVMFALWAIHFLLNRRWCLGLLKGKYSSFRILQLIINTLLLFAVLGVVLSSVVISGEVFSSFTFDRDIETAQRVHIFSAFWYFILMSLHLGLHWKTVSQKFLRGVKPRIIWVMKGLLIPICIYGVYSFLKNDIVSYLFLVSSYVFFDFERPVILYVTEYLSIMALFISIMHYGLRLLNRRR